MSWTLRHARDADMGAIAEVIAASEREFLGRTSTTEASHREHMKAEEGFDLEANQMVAEQDGQIIGVAVMVPRFGSFGGVRPGFHSVGLRAALLDWEEARQREVRSAPVPRIAVLGGDPITEGLMAERGYHVERSYLRMKREFALTGPPEPATVPAGYRLRPIDRDADVEMLWRLDDRAFRERADYDPVGMESFDAHNIHFSEYESEWSFVMETDAGVPAGFLIGWRRPDHGYVSLLGVDPDHRHRGLGRTVLGTACERVFAAGLPVFALHVASDNPKALELYESVGMTATEREDCYIPG